MNKKIKMILLGFRDDKLRYHSNFQLQKTNLIL